jgi:thiol-disulfide isomerase/thioredoxin
MRAILVFCLILALAGCQKAQVQEVPSNETASAEAGIPTKGVDRSHKGAAMPGAQIFNADDDQSTLAEAKGKPVLVNLWASWCAPCVKELPTLDALSRRKGAPRIIAVSEDVGGRPSVEAFLEQHGIKDLEAWRDPEMALTGALEVQVMPTTVYYDAEGREVWRYVGDLDWTGDEAAKLLAEAVPAGAD